MNLFEKLNKLSNDSSTVRKLALEKAYNEIQAEAVEKLNLCAKQSVYNCKFALCDFFYTSNLITGLKFTDIGNNFAKYAGLPELPTPDELNYIHTKLKDYLLSEGLDVALSSPSMYISWASK
jgi:hypothetical protein